MAIINKPSDYFNTKLYTGNGGTQSITGVGFQPDFNWTKSRTTTQSHVLTDAVRGVTKTLFTNATQAEATLSGITAFGTDGYTLGASDLWSENSASFASWNWLANGAGSANTDGSISSTVSANTTSGFSIVKWTGSGSSATLGHGLNSTPKCIIVKNLTDSTNWFLYNHSVITASSTNKSFMTLNTIDALGTNGSATTFTSVSDTTFGVGTDNIINGSNDSMMAYVFVEKNGFSKFGSYVGNGSTNGTFIHLGFQPAFIIVKRTDSTGDWQIMDNKRDPINVMDTNLFVNSADADTASSTYNTDFVSNGIKFRGTSGARNGSGMSYIYMAFAKNPFVTSTDNGSIPGTAR